MLAQAGAAAAGLGASRLPPQPPVVTEHEDFLASLRDGLRYVLRDPVTRWLVALSVVASTFLRPLRELLPAFATTSLGVGPTELSWLFAVMAAGGVAGAASTILIGGSGFGRQGLVTLLAMVAWGVVLIGVSLQETLVPALLLIAFPQVCWSMFASISQVIVQMRAPDHLRGRAMSFYGTSVSAFMPFGNLVIGALGTAVGIGLALRIGAVTGLVAAVAVLLFSASVRTVGVRSSRGG